MAGDKDDKSRSKREIAWRLIHSYQYHDNGTGFNEWKPGTPQHVKDLQREMFDRL
ncbi:MAG: hypothetical protein WAW23_08425 [Candidatus Methanoperedens sp.]